MLEYYIFKQKWKVEVQPSLLPEQAELNYLKESIPNDAKDRLYEVSSLNEAWKKLDLLYGQSMEICSKLKKEMDDIRIAAKHSPYTEIEVYVKVQAISSKIKAAGAYQMLTGDHEYVSLIFKLLDSNSQNEWIKGRKTGWSDFYKFLEGIYEEALQKKLLLESAQ